MGTLTAEYFLFFCGEIIPSPTYFVTTGLTKIENRDKRKIIDACPDSRRQA